VVAVVAVGGQKSAHQVASRLSSQVSEPQPIERSSLWHPDSVCVVFELEVRIALVAAPLVMVLLVQAAEVAVAQYLRRVRILKLRRYAQVTLWAYPAVRH
jgi:hypothetical protein